MAKEQLGIVVIGRNESPRLALCLKSIGHRLDRTVYVDSGSSDGSADIAEKLGAAVVRLTDGPFTAARGRRIGVEYLRARFPETTLIQFIDGDCELSVGWIDTGSAFLEANPRAAAVVGRLREKFPERSLLVKLTDLEWELPVGTIDVIGGISLMRNSALSEVGGWRDGLIAGEELDLSVRVRAAGWSLHRLAAPMCTHDIGITRLQEFWWRAARSGYAYTRLSLLHPKQGPRRWMRRALGNIFYGLVLPAIVLVGIVLWWPAALAAALIGATLVLRLAIHRIRRGDQWGVAAAYGFVSGFCKLAAALGTMKCLFHWATGRQAKLMEYTRPAPLQSVATGGVQS